MKKSASVTEKNVKNLYSEHLEACFDTFITFACTFVTFADLQCNRPPICREYKIAETEKILNIRDSNLLFRFHLEA